MKDFFNDELLKTIKERLIDDSNPANFLVDTLGIGKEAAYRRLRGNVPISLHEAALIAKALKISLDEITGNIHSDGAMFAHNGYNTEDPFSYFHLIIKHYVESFQYVCVDPQSTANVATNALPYTYFFQYKHLIKFRLCRWLHQLEKVHAQGCMDKIFIRQDVMDTAQKMGGLLMEIPTTTIILDKGVFRNMVNNIRYFKDLNLISNDDVKELQDELYDLADLAESSAAKGEFKNGTIVNLYLSNIDIEGSYSYIEKEGFLLSLFHLYEIDNIYSTHPAIGKMHKNWVLSLRRYSTLVSKCGEKDRTEFFTKQREIISTLRS